MHCVKVGCEANVSEENAVSLLGIKVQWDKYTRVHSQETARAWSGSVGLLNWEELEMTF